MENKESKQENKNTKSILLNKILELQSSTFGTKKQIGALVNFIQSLFEIESIGIYANFANEQINLINSKSGTKQFNYLGHILENLANQIDLRDSRFYNSLIPISELDIKNLSDSDLNTFVYPIVSPYAKQIFGIILISNPKRVNSQE